MRASSAAPSASRTGSSSIRSRMSWKKPRTIRRSASARGEAARHQVEELLAVDPAERRAVGAADVVGEDLEPGDRVGVRLLGEQQVAVLLVGVRLLRVLLDADHPAPDGVRVLAQRALEGEVGLGRGRDVLLEGVVVEVLRAVGEVGAGDARGGAGAAEVVLDPDLARSSSRSRRRPSRARRRARRARGATRSATSRCERFWIETYSSFARLPDEELGDRVRVAAAGRGATRRTPRSA